LRIVFIERLRDELKFNSVEELIEAIRHDERMTREILRRDGSPSPSETKS
jgi:FAD synthase